MAEHLFQTPVAVSRVTTDRAGFWRRFMAAWIDGLLLGAVTLPVSAATGMSPWVALLEVVLALVYFGGLEGTSGQTLGKRALSIRVVDADTGDSIGVGRALARWFGRILSTIVIYLGYLWMLWDRNKQTWHDKLSSSVVVPA
jgi:uncharacterized RDD family membrane protein YckC